jgi:hypothetical protein
MKSVALVKNRAAGLVTCVALITTPLPLVAQEAVQQQEGSGGQMEMRGMMGKHPGMMGDMHKMHERMEKMHQEVSQELQKQITALREHSKAMEGMSDEKQLLTEMKKHQQMTDGLLGTMLEQREKMHAQMQAHHERMRSRMGKEQPAEGSGTEQSGEHEQHHDE